MKFGIHPDNSTKFGIRPENSTILMPGKIWNSSRKFQLLIVVSKSWFRDDMSMLRANSCCKPFADWFSHVDEYLSVVNLSLIGHVVRRADCSTNRDKTCKPCQVSLAFVFSQQASTSQLALTLSQLAHGVCISRFTQL